MKNKLNEMTAYEKDSFIDAVEVTLDYNEPVSEEDYALYEELIKERSSKQKFQEIIQILDKCKELPQPYKGTSGEKDTRLKQGEAEIALELGIPIFAVSEAEGYHGSDAGYHDINRIESKEELIRYTALLSGYRNMAILQPNYPEEEQQIIANYLRDVYEQRLNKENKKYDIEKSKHTKTGEDIWNETNNNFNLEQVSVRLKKETPLYSGKSIESAEDAVRTVGQELMAQLDREQICIINLNAARKPINFSITSVGALNQALAEPREMLKASILSNAGSVIMLHNHTSGSIEPSKEDYQMTAQMIQSFGSVGIKVLDHVIIGGNNLEDFYSIREDDIRMFEEYKPNFEKLKISDISEHLLREINVFLVAEDLSYWINNTHTTISLTDEEAETILNYMDGHGYNLGVEDKKLVRIDIEEENPTAEVYNIEEVIYAVCDWNSDLISETEEKINTAYSVEEVYGLREYMKSLHKDEDVIDAMFKKTSLGKTLELGTKNEEINQQKKKEKVI